MNELRDIKGLVEIDDYSTFLILLAVLVFMILVLFVSYKFFKTPSYKFRVKSDKEIA